jgi:hypothetical protein
VLYISLHLLVNLLKVSLFNFVFDTEKLTIFKFFYRVSGWKRPGWAMSNRTSTRAATVRNGRNGPLFVAQCAVRPALSACPSYYSTAQTDTTTSPFSGQVCGAPIRQACQALRGKLSATKQRFITQVQVPVPVALPGKKYLCLDFVAEHLLLLY